MAYEDSIQYLLHLFLQYKLARSPGERSRLDAEIMQLFDTLGASLSPEILAVRQDFETMRTPAPPVSSLSRQTRLAANRFVRARISKLEKVPDAPVLTWGARELLRVPIIEAFESEEYHNAEEADASMRKIAASLREQPRSPREGQGRLRTSIAVIRAYAQNFCNIPPFCSGKRYE